MRSCVVSLISLRLQVDALNKANSLRRVPKELQEIRVAATESIALSHFVIYCANHLSSPLTEARHVAHQMFNLLAPCCLDSRGQPLQSVPRWFQEFIPLQTLANQVHMIESQTPILDSVPSFATNTMHSIILFLGQVEAILEFHISVLRFEWSSDGNWLNTEPPLLQILGHVSCLILTPVPTRGTSLLRRRMVKSQCSIAVRCLQLAALFVKFPDDLDMNTSYIDVLALSITHPSQLGFDLNSENQITILDGFIKRLLAEVQKRKSTHKIAQTLISNLKERLKHENFDPISLARLLAEGVDDIRVYTACKVTVRVFKLLLGSRLLSDCVNSPLSSISLGILQELVHISQQGSPHPTIIEASSVLLELMFSLSNVATHVCRELIREDAISNVSIWGQTENTASQGVKFASTYGKHLHFHVIRQVEHFAQVLLPNFANLAVQNILVDSARNLQTDTRIQPSDRDKFLRCLFSNYPLSQPFWSSKTLFLCGLRLLQMTIQASYEDISKSNSTCHLFNEDIIHNVLAVLTSDDYTLREKGKQQCLSTSHALKAMLESCAGIFLISIQRLQRQSSQLLKLCYVDYLWSPKRSRVTPSSERNFLKCGTICSKLYNSPPVPTYLMR